MSRSTSRPARFAGTLLLLVAASVAWAQPAPPSPAGPAPRTSLERALAAELPAAERATVYQRYRFTGVDPSEAEALLAEATAAVYLPDWGEFWLLTSPRQRGIAPAFARLAGEPRPAIAPWELAEAHGLATLEAFAADIAGRYPGLESGALGHYLAKFPSVRRGAPLAPPSPAPPARAQSIALSEGFEVSPWSRWQRDDNNGGQYTWEVTSCDAHGGTRSADAVRGGTSGAALGCTSSYPPNVDTLMVDGACESFQGAQQAWLDLYANLNSEGGHDYLGIYFADEGGQLYGYGFSGNFGAWIRLDFNLRQWFNLGDLAANACNRLAFDFESDAVGAPGFGARVDDITIRSGEAPPVTCGASASPASGPKPLNVVFTGSSTGVAGPSYYWWFDDGTSSSTSQSPTHTYNTVGEYDPCFRAAGASDLCYACTHVSVTAASSFTVAVGASTTSGPAPLAVQFTATPSGGKAPYTYFWSFDDGSAGSNEQNPAHAFNAAGTYHVSLSVHDFANVWATGGVTITVTPGSAPLTAGATGSPTSGQAPLTVHFLGGASGGTPPYAYAWSFGDGTLGSSEQNPTHIYIGAGTFVATLTVRDAASASAAASVSITATSPPNPVVATASADVTTGAAPLTVHFTGGASGGTPPYTYGWSFGDGTPGSSEQNPSHVYTSAGTHTAVLTVHDAASGTGSASVTVNAVEVMTYRYLVGAVAHNPGYGGTLWRTDIAAVGAEDADAEITLTFRSGGTTASQTASLAAGATVEWANVLETVFGVAADASRSGSIEIVSSAPLSVTSRTFNQGSAGTYGQYIPALTEADALSAGQFGVLPQLKKNADFRTNIGAVNLGATACAVAVRLFDAAGGQVGTTRTLNVSPGGWSQESDAFVLAGAGEHDIAYATVEVLTPGGRAWVYASVVDAKTGDPTTVPVIVPQTDGIPASWGVIGPAAGSGDDSTDVVPEILQTAPPYVPPRILSQATGVGAAMANAYAGYWYGSTSQKLPLNIHVTDGGVVDYLTIRLKLSLVTFSCTGDASPSGTFPLSGGALDTTVYFPGSNITSHVQGSFTSSTAASGTFSGFSGAFSLICGSTIAWGTGSLLGSGTWTAGRETAPPLSASASADVTSGGSPVTVHFTGTASGGTPNYSYGWDFDDGYYSTSQNPTHTYKKAGTHHATFYVWDAHNWSASASVTITVTAPPFSASASGSPTSGPAPLAVTFAATPSGGVSPYAYSWDFGDGSSKSTSQNPTHTYATAGDYTATLTAKDDAVQSATATVAIHVTPPPPVSVTASADVTSGYVPLTVHFTGSASGGATPYTWSWDFGDGSAASTSQNPTHTYSAVGTYTATLTARDAASQTGSASVSITVTPPPPVSVTASADVTSGQAPLTVHLSGSASGGTPPYGYAWGFGDGTPAASGQYPTHVYQGAGSYTATLTVTDSASATGSATVQIAVGAPPAQYVYLVPAVAHNPGTGGTLWRTDIGAVNPGAAWASFTLRFVGSGGGGPFVTSLAPGAATEWPNVLEGVFEVGAASSASGAVEIASDRPLVLAARTYNATAAGTYGQYLPALTHADTLTSGQGAVLPQLKKNAAFRTNIGAVNHGETAGTVSITLFNAAGNQVGNPRTITVQPSAWVQHNDVFTLTGAGQQDVAYAKVEVVTGGALMWVYASVVDELTGDPTAIPVIRR